MPATAADCTTDTEKCQLHDLWQSTTARSAPIQKAVRNIDQHNEHAQEIDEIFVKALEDAMDGTKCDPSLPAAALLYADESELHLLWTEAQAQSPVVQAFLKPFIDRHQLEIGRNFLQTTDSELRLQEQVPTAIISDFPPVPPRPEPPLCQRPRLTAEDVTYADIAMEARWLKQSYCRYIAGWVRLSRSTVSELPKNSSLLESATQTLSQLVGDDAVRTLSGRLEMCSTAMKHISSSYSQ
jgi:hypothetical protein